MAGRVGVDLVPLDSCEVGGCLQQPGPERNGFGVRALRVVDVQIDVDLLRVPVRPIGRDMVGCELHADHPLVVGIEDAVKRVVGEHLAVEHARPEGAFSREVRRVEHDNVSHEVHPSSFTGAGIAVGRLH